jgi:adenosylcobinamide-GDP ribazoletransferase
MLHLDGLADSGDGLLAPMSRERRLAVMRDPAIGAFGVVTVTLVALLRVGALAGLAPDIGLLVGLWAASRGLMTVVLVAVPYARTPDPEQAGLSGGLASAFEPTADDRRRTLAAGVVCTAVALVVVVVAGGWPGGPAAAAGLVLGGVGVVALAYRRLGGFTGDVLGAAGVVGETCGLLLAAGQW